MNRKYPKITGSWTYGHIVVPEKLIYIGSSDEPECCIRWNPGHYINTELQPYIEKHGWENIKHIVFKDGLTPKQAEQLEDLLITQAKIDGWCINKKGSGGEWRDNPVECKKQYREDHKGEISQYSKQYYQDHKEEKKEWKKQYYKANIEGCKEYSKQYRETHKEECREYNKQQRSTIEGKIYNRVNNYNRNHIPIETPKEAKQKYLETRYIPNYIKKDDLI